VLTRIVASLATLLATTFGEPAVHRPAASVAAPARQIATVDARDLVLSFGDTLEELHDAVGFEDVDAGRVERACRSVLAQYSPLRDAVGKRGTDLLVAAESMVDACRTGLAEHLDLSSFEIVDGDYFAYRELSFNFAD
jgi:hypothetical protein